MSSLDPIDENSAMPDAAAAGHAAPDVGTRTPPPSRGRAQNVGTPSLKPRSLTAASGERFDAWPTSRDERECNDVVHGDVSMPPAVHAVLDTPPVQRLRNLLQLGCASYAYPCATHKRLEHSLGVMELARCAAEGIRGKQPELGVAERDVLCLQFTGLCHDLGHGPFSHCFETFSKAAYKAERESPELYEERNRRFKEEYGVEMPPLPKEYEHENTSLMMVDFALACIGLEIDWDNLDEPLKQIGDGIDRELFGVRTGKDTYDPLTSRDWIFVKECISGGPLDVPDAPVAQTAWVGREPEKEFLYDVVSNRHNGMDVDKMDYFSSE